jgi:hypothetical protein
MTTSATIPVTVTPEAAARIAKLGIQAEVDRMIDYARHNIPELARIEVNLYDRYELGDEPGLSVDIYSRHPFDQGDCFTRDMGHWVVRTFPPEVLVQVIMDYHPGGSHAW